MPSPLVVSPLAARRFARAALRFDAPHPDVAAALDYHGYIQIDPINICGRMHDLILRNRVVDYREGDLMRHLHGAADANGANGTTLLNAGEKKEGKDARPARPRQENEASTNRTNRERENSTASDGRADRPSLPARAARNSRAPAVTPKPASERTAFEHHAPDTGNLAAYPLEAWPHLQAEMRARARRTSAWSGRLTPRERELAPRLLEEIAARGPLGSEDFEDERRAHRVVWGAASLVKATLQKLFFHGQLLISQRSNNRRRYDLPERVLPAAVLAQPEPSAAETARWLALLKLRQRRLVTLKREELRLVEDAVQALAVEGCPTLYCLRSDLPLLEAAQSPASDLSILNPQLSTSRPHLLAPLDPLIYDRRLTAALWKFDYTWEAYTPPAKRVRGYYALPVLIGTEIVGHVEPRADRDARRLRIVSRRIKRGHGIAESVHSLAQWLGLRTR